MAKESMKARERKRERLVVRYSKKRAELTKVLKSTSDSEEIIGRWVENILQTKVTDIRWVMNRAVSELRIPN